MKPSLVELKQLISEHSRPRLKKDLGHFSLQNEEGVLLQSGHVIELVHPDFSLTLRAFARALKQSFAPESEPQPHLQPSHSPQTKRVALLFSQQLQLFPLALAQAGIPLEQLLFLEEVPREQGLEVLLTLIRSECFSWIACESIHLPDAKLDAQLRKVQLSLEESGSALFILGKKPLQSFAITHRFLITSSPEEKHDPEYRTLSF